MKTIIYNNKMKTKNLIIAFALVLTPLFTFAQSAFDNFADMDDVSVVKVNKKMFELMKGVASGTDDAKEYVSLISGLDNLRVLATENASIAAQMKSKVKSYLKSSNLSELMSVKDKEGNVKIANAFIIKKSAFPKLEKIMDSFIENRKSVFKLALSFGLINLLKLFVFKSISVEQLERAFFKAVDINVKGYFTQNAQLAVDLDKESDIEDLTKYLRGIK